VLLTYKVILTTSFVVT